MSNYAQNCANKRNRVATIEEIQFNIDVTIPYLFLLAGFEQTHRSLAYILVSRWNKANLTHKQKLGRLRMLMNEQ